ncbi:HNH endonuclease [Enterobacter asburiae]|uniref:HNH endonuclease n=1 Tax=Enterobacter asburiae TaxID=61645 RepID=UPI00288A029E|nr:HNH endonuclease [Enterobacter asburiae]WNI64763.1 HNH endonuclease [Enterobacter asburiae]WNI67004.1 HNH endonuclease [Enterobacter asburiae]
MTIAKSLSQKIAGMKTAWYNKAPALNKPLLVLYVLSQYKKGHERLFQFQDEVQDQLRDLLKRYGPKRSNYEVLMPFWRLKHDGFWALEGTDSALLKSPEEPRLQTFLDNNVRGGFDVTSFFLLQNQKLLIDSLAKQVVVQYLPIEFHSALFKELGFETPEPFEVNESPNDRIALVQPDIDIITQDLSIDETTRTALIQARIGQGNFRAECLRLYPACPVTGITFQPLLRASHIKPWSACQTAKERLDPYNGLMLAAHIDTLFDSGWISFANEGDVLISNHLDFDTCDKLSLPERIIALPKPSYNYLQWHWQNVFKG